MKQSIHTNHKMLRKTRRIYEFIMDGKYRNAGVPDFGKGHPEHTVLIIAVVWRVFCAPNFYSRRVLITVLLEKDRICQGVTGHTTAKITAQHGLIYEKSLQSMGQGACRTVSESKFKSGGKL